MFDTAALAWGATTVWFRSDLECCSEMSLLEVMLPSETFTVMELISLLLQDERSVGDEAGKAPILVQARSALVQQPALS